MAVNATLFVNAIYRSSFQCNELLHCLHIIISRIARKKVDQNREIELGGIEVIISPYEADAQLAHLCQIGYCDSVLTEDSDILVYSAICGVPFNVFYKFDRVGAVQVINFGDINFIGANSDSEIDAVELPSSQSSEDFVSISGKSTKNSSKAAKEKEEKSFLPTLKHFKGPSGRRMFAQMCILAGCDYSESIFGVGMMAAQKVLHYLSCHLYHIMT